MIVLFLILILFVMAGFMVLWASKLPGGLTLDLGTGTLYEFELVYALLALIFLGGGLALIWSMISGLIGLPSRLIKSRRQAQRLAANQALADGLLAAEAGDAKRASKLAAKASRHASDDRLKLLLEARTAEVTDDWSSAERAWSLLSRLPGGQLAGLRGAASAARARGDIKQAETLARQALTLKTGADWPFDALFDSQVVSGEWQEALTTLKLGEKRQLIDSQRLKRRRAVLSTAQAMQQAGPDRKDAQHLLAEAIQASASFPPAIWHGARHLMLDKKYKSALNILVLGWKTRPHPALAHLTQHIDLTRQTDFTAETCFEKLIAAYPEHRESRILEAQCAMLRKDWHEAVKRLALLIEERPTARLSLLLEKAMIGYGDRKEAEHWARTAITAPREPEWSDLDPKGGTFQYTQKDWCRLVYAFGDTGQLIHPRFEASERELEVGKRLALPLNEAEDKIKSGQKKAQLAKPPLDYPVRPR